MENIYLRRVGFRQVDGLRYISYNVMEKYICVADDLGNIVEIPTESDGTISLTTLISQFVGASGLKYQGPSGFWRALRIENKKIYPPRDVQNWEDIQYNVVQMKENKRKIDDCNDEDAIKLRKKTFPKKCNDLIALGLNPTTTPESLKKAFIPYGDVILAEVKRDAKSGKSKGYGFIRFANYESQLKVLMKKINIDGRWCAVKLPDSKGGNAAVSGSKIFIGGVDHSMTAHDLKIFFESSFDTQVVDVFFVPSKNYAFVTFLDWDTAHSLYGESFEINGKSIFCRPAEPIGDPYHNHHNTDQNQQLMGSKKSQKVSNVNVKKHTLRPNGPGFNNEPRGLCSKDAKLDERPFGSRQVSKMATGFPEQQPLLPPLSRNYATGNSIPGLAPYNAYEQQPPQSFYDTAKACKERGYEPRLQPIGFETHNARVAAYSRKLTFQQEDEALEHKGRPINLNPIPVGAYIHNDLCLDRINISQNSAQIPCYGRKKSTTSLALNAAQVKNRLRHPLLSSATYQRLLRKKGFSPSPNLAFSEETSDGHAQAPGAKISILTKNDQPFAESSKVFASCAAAAPETGNNFGESYGLGPSPSCNISPLSFRLQQERPASPDTTTDVGDNVAEPTQDLDCDNGSLVVLNDSEDETGLITLRAVSLSCSSSTAQDLSKGDLQNSYSPFNLTAVINATKSLFHDKDSTKIRPALLILPCAPASKKIKIKGGSSSTHQEAKLPNAPVKECARPKGRSNSFTVNDLKPKHDPLPAPFPKWHTNLRMRAPALSFDSVPLASNVKRSSLEARSSDDIEIGLGRVRRESTSSESDIDNHNRLIRSRSIGNCTSYT